VILVDLLDTRSAPEVDLASHGGRTPPGYARIRNASRTSPSSVSNNAFVALIYALTFALTVALTVGLENTLILLCAAGPVSF